MGALGGGTLSKLVQAGGKAMGAGAKALESGKSGDGAEDKGDASKMVKSAKDLATKAVAGLHKRVGKKNGRKPVAGSGSKTGDKPWPGGGKDY